MLKDIITDIESELAVQAQVGEADRNIIVKWINDAIAEWYNTNDIKESLDQDVIDFNVSAQTVALPSHMELIRGMRFFSGGLPIEWNDIKNRYNNSIYGENNTWYLKWREQGYKCLARPVENYSVLSFTLPFAAPEAFNVTVTGKTPNSNRVSETLSFALGDVTKTTANNWVGTPVSITKSAYTTYDIEITDVENNILGYILNNEFNTRYLILQVLDSDDSSATGYYDSVEVLYKKHLEKLSNDGDLFLGTDKYDKVIVWKTLAHQASEIQQKQYFDGKAMDIFNKIQANEKVGQKEKINYPVNKFFNLPYAGYYNRWRGRYAKN